MRPQCRMRKRQLERFERHTQRFFQLGQTFEPHVTKKMQRDVQLCCRYQAGGTRPLPHVAPCRQFVTNSLVRQQGDEQSGSRFRRHPPMYRAAADGGASKRQP